MKRGEATIWNGLPWIFLACAGVFLLFANGGDWDFFLTGLEVDRRAWLLDHELPLWSYQLCGGVTRLGDPQSYGLSPIFVPIIAVGALIGSKILLLALWSLGFYFLRRTLELAGSRREVAVGLSLLFFSSNYFLWHLVMGHANFAMLGLLLPLIYYLALSWRKALQARQKLAVALSSWAFWSGAFYHTLVFFALPLVVPALVAGGWAVLRADREDRLRILRGTREWGIDAALGMTLASYKWLPVLKYQHDHPRALLDRPAEIPSLLRLLADEVLPTINGRFPLRTQGNLPYGIHEWSVFSLIPWLLLTVLLVGAGRLPQRLREEIPRLDFVGVLAISGLCVSLLFCLGDAASWLPMPWLNSVVFGQSVRVAGRFQIVPVFCLLLLLARISVVSPSASRWLVSLGLPVGLALALVNLATFAPLLSARDLLTLARVPASDDPKLGLPVIVPPAFSGVGEYPSNSWMYPAARQGKIILDCYDPLARQALVAGDQGPQIRMEHGPWQGEYQLVENDITGADELARCRQFISLTQNHLNLPVGACAPGTCLNLNAVNAGDGAGLEIVAGKRRYCLGSRRGKDK